MSRVRVRTGSSPLTRGKLRSYPARTTALVAHPRSRGENALPVKINEVSSGSSPLTRGKPSADQPHYVGKGLIPAHAGKTLPRGNRQSAGTAHPRSRGENSLDPPADSSPQGSSPLTRGKLRRDDRGGIVSRLIPAHAGKTSASRWVTSLRGAHPRSRGENITIRAGMILSLGSSPLTRGKHPLHPWRVRRRRLIPAHAGKTNVEAIADQAYTAHPRSRGENCRNGTSGTR